MYHEATEAVSLSVGVLRRGMLIQRLWILGDAARDRLSDAGSIPARSTDSRVMHSHKGYVWQEGMEKPREMLKIQCFRGFFYGAPNNNE